MKRVLITGANRGIGLAIARLCADRGDEVIATARNTDEATALADLGVRVEPLDVAHPASTAELADRLGGVQLDRLINNAGVFPDRGASLAEIDPDAIAQAFAINATGPTLVTRALRPNLKGAGALVVNVSSIMASIASAHSTGSTRNLAYHASKAALNMMTVLMSSELKADGITVIAMHPGWVRTDMGGAGAALATEDSAGAMLRTWDRLSIDDTGRFMSNDGADLPW